jgi:poly-gamma-glutamate synthesis protein (capsule biosynthesis protein)
MGTFGKDTKKLMPHPNGEFHYNRRAVEDLTLAYNRFIPLIFAIGILLYSIALALLIVRSRASSIAQASVNNYITIAAVGDVLLGGKVGTQAEYVVNETPLDSVKDILEKADIAICNLECPLSNKGTPTPSKTLEELMTKREFLFRGIPEGAEYLKSVGFDVVSLANNHIMDYSSEALKDTLNALDSAGISYSGGGMDLHSARMPAILDAGGLRVAFLSYVWAGTLPRTKYFEAGNPGAGCAVLRTDNSGRLLKESVQMLRDDLSKARQTGDIVVVSLHWGIEGKHRPLRWQRELARDIIDLGADVVLGHHPHVLQGIEFYKNKPILYSLGNFVFPSVRDANNNTCIAFIKLGTANCELEIKPIRITNGFPHPASMENSMHIAKLVAFLSAELGTPSTIRNDGTVVIRSALSSTKAEGL